MYVYNTILLSLIQFPPPKPAISKEAFATICKFICFFSIHAHILKPIRPTVLLKQEPLPIRKPSRDAPFTFRRFGAVEIGYVLVSYIPEPVRWSISIDYKFNCYV